MGKHPFTARLCKGLEKPKAVECRRLVEKKPALDDGKVILWHGTPEPNASSIQKRGLIPPKPRKNAVDAMILQVAKDVGLKENQIKKLRKSSNAEYARSRIGEASRAGSVVYLSGDASYARANSLAGCEWKTYLYSEANRIKYSRYTASERRHEIANYNRLLKIEKLGESYKEAMKAGDYDRARLISDQQTERMRERNEAVDKFYEDPKNRGVVRKMNDNLKKATCNNRYALFRVALPWETFEKLASDEDKKSARFYENSYRSYVRGEPVHNWFHLVDEYHGKDKFSFFREVHLKKVPPRYLTLEETGYKS